MDYMVALQFLIFGMLTKINSSFSITGTQLKSVGTATENFTPGFISPQGKRVIVLVQSP